MDIKKILKDPNQAIIDHWGADIACPYQEKILELVDLLSTIKKNDKQLKSKKKEIAGQFRHTQEQDAIATLKKAMQQISSDIAQSEEKRKSYEKELATLFASQPTTSKPELPERFRLTKKTPTQQATSAVRIREANFDDSTAWNAFVNTHPNASAYHLFDWKSVIESCFGHACYYLIAEDENSIIGILPLIELRSQLFGCYAVSVPFFNYGGPLTYCDEVTQQLYKKAGELSTSRQWEHIEYRTTKPGLDMPSLSKKSSMILDLPANFETLEQQLGSKIRAQYNKAREHNPTVCFGGLELLDDFYRVFAANMRDLGTPVYSKGFFKKIIEVFDDRVTLVVVKVNQRPAGAAFLFGYKEVLEIPWASTLKQFNAMNINMWMYRSILEKAIEKGFEYFDFGRSTAGEGTYKFKAQWGAKPVPHYWYYLLSDGGQLPQLNPDNPKFKLAISIWKRLPTLITNVLGPRIVKYLP